MPLEEHIGPIRLQQACSAGLMIAPGCMQAIAGFTRVPSNSTSAKPICETLVNALILHVLMKYCVRPANRKSFRWQESTHACY